MGSRTIEYDLRGILRRLEALERIYGRLSSIGLLSGVACFVSLLERKEQWTYNSLESLRIDPKTTQDTGKHTKKFG